MRFDLGGTHHGKPAPNNAPTQMPFANQAPDVPIFLSALGSHSWENQSEARSMMLFVRSKMLSEGAQAYCRSTMKVLGSWGKIIETPSIRALEQYREGTCPDAVDRRYLLGNLSQLLLLVVFLSRKDALPVSKLRKLYVEPFSMATLIKIARKLAAYELIECFQEASHNNQHYVSPSDKLNQVCEELVITLGYTANPEIYCRAALKTILAWRNITRVSYIRNIEQEQWIGRSNTIRRNRCHLLDARSQQTLALLATSSKGIYFTAFGRAFAEPSDTVRNSTKRFAPLAKTLSEYSLVRSAKETSPGSRRVLFASPALPHAINELTAILDSGFETDPILEELGVYL